MTTLTIGIHDSTARSLAVVSKREGCEINDTAARWLKRALLVARPRPQYDIERIRSENAAFLAEDRAFDDLVSEEMVELLRRADEGFGCSLPLSSGAWKSEA